MLGEFDLHGPDLTQDEAGMMRQRLTRSGWRYSPAAAIEQ